MASVPVMMPAGEGGSDFHVAAFKELEQALGVFFFLKRGFSEDVGDLHKAVFFGRTGKIIIAGCGPEIHRAKAVRIFLSVCVPFKDFIQSLLLVRNEGG